MNLLMGKKLKLMDLEFNKDKIKFVSYSNKIKPEIQNLFDKLNVGNIPK